MLRTVLAIAFIGFQVGMIVHARFSPFRYYCWAPHDVQNKYWVNIEIHQQELSQSEIEDRYRGTLDGLDQHSIEHVKQLIRQYESTYGAQDSATVTLKFRKNGGPLSEWRWPES